MFPDWQEETLKNLLELRGSADAVALHITTTSTNTEMPQESFDNRCNDISDSDDEDGKLMRPTFAAVTLPSRNPPLFLQISLQMFQMCLLIDPI